VTISKKLATQLGRPNPERIYWALLKPLGRIVTSDYPAAQQPEQDNILCSCKEGEDWVATKDYQLRFGFCLRG
jgi:hypothetical protein